MNKTIINKFVMLIIIQNAYEFDSNIKSEKNELNFV